MAHLVETMFSVKERPWHGLGKVITEAPTIEEGIKLAGLDWKVSLREIKSNDPDEIVLPNKRMVVREDKKEALGIVGTGYQPVQNDEAFKFFEPFVENNLASLETAGSLWDGRRIFVLAKINQEDMHITDEDVVEKYILLSNSHDGSSTITVGYTPIRVVCNNTLSAALESSSSNLIRVYHKGDVVYTLSQLQETMDLVNQQFIATEEKYKELAKKNVSKLDLHKYVKQVFSSKTLDQIVSDYATEQEEKEQIEATRKRLIARVEEIFDMEPVHNAWTMYNSVNYYLNHERGKSLNNRYGSMWYGDSKRVDNKALKLALLS